MRAYIGVGSNLGDRVGHCTAAVEALAQLDRTRVTACSPWYETEPVGGVEQGWYLNGAV
ncbi:MAG: 2-amino-4-hydroxy-6-hydroxymethyldihydropteridine diphosphokinase, partial [Nitrospirae bacterium]|nr:2-amino-4-hydroxy-6-hydroxymethyldihydropteridine diphosphokinase [Nitrospirota bacterium]